MNLEHLKTLCGDDEAILQSIIQVFVQTMETNINALKDSISEKDGKKIEFTAHKIKGSAGQFRATELHDLALQLEVKGKLNELSFLEELFTELTREYARLKIQIERQTQSTSI
jgi:HPt (histidine-containing phosphotransfer) domain-containing protein